MMAGGDVVGVNTAANRRIKIAEEPESRNVFTDAYDQQVKLRERQREEWRLNLQQ